MERSYKIKLDINDIGKFTKQAGSIPNPVEIRSGRFSANGKSLMGCYSLDLTKEIELIIHDNDDENLIKEKFGRWLV